MKLRMISVALVCAFALLSAMLTIPLISTFHIYVESILLSWFGTDFSRLALDTGQAILGFVILFLVLGIAIKLNKGTLLFVFRPDINPPSNVIILSIILGLTIGIMTTVFVSFSMGLLYRISSYLTVHFY